MSINISLMVKLKFLILYKYLWRENSILRTWFLPLFLRQLFWAAPSLSPFLWRPKSILKRIWRFLSARFFWTCHFRTLEPAASVITSFWPWKCWYNESIFESKLNRKIFKYWLRTPLSRQQLLRVQLKAWLKYLNV